MKRKQALGLILFTLVMSCIVFHDQITSSFFQWYLKGFCEERLGADLVYERLLHQNGTWKLENARMSSLKKNSENDYQIEVQAVDIDVNFIWPQIFDVSIVLDSPQVDCRIGVRKVKDIIQKDSKSWHFFKFETHLDIPKGILRFHDPLDQENELLLFSLNIHNGENREARLAFWFDDTEKVNHSIQASIFESDSKVINVEIASKEFEIKALKSGLREFFPLLNSCDVLRGKIDGALNISFHKIKPIYANGSIVITDLLVIDSDLECKLQIPEIVLKLDSNNDRSFSPIVGSLDIKNKGELSFVREQKTYWSFHDLEGSLSFETNQQAKFVLRGICCSPSGERSIDVEATAKLRNSIEDRFSIQLNLKDETLNEVVANLTLHKHSNGENFLQAKLLGFGKDEVNLIQHLLAPLYPEISRIHFLDGTTDAFINSTLNNMRIGKVEVEQLIAHNLELDFDAWNLSVGTLKTVGGVSFDLLAQNFMLTLNADLVIDGGKVCVAGLDTNKWQLNEIQTNLAIRKGILQRSSLEAEMAGLHGKIDLNLSDDPLLSFEFQGCYGDFNHILPNGWKNSLEKQFSDDEFKILAKAKPSLDGLCFEGEIFNNNIDRIFFGFSLEKSSIKKGWFKADRISLSKYISPLLFPENQMQLKGIGEFLGKFDEQQISLCYDAQNIILENSDFVIELKQIVQDESKRGEQRAKHFFDINKNTSHGSIQISDGIYFEKNSGLLFTDVTADLDLDNNKIHISNLETFCTGIYFCGAIDVDWSQPGEGVFVVDILADQMHGRISQIMDFFSHFSQTPLPFSNLPIEGNVELRKKGARIHFDFQGRDYTFQSEVEGIMSDCKVTIQNSHIALQEINACFEYNYLENFLDFSDIQATLLIGSNESVGEYSLAGDYVKFTNYAKNEAKFDLWIGDKKRDLVRLVGSTHGTDSLENYIDFELDRKLSHFSNFHPSLFQLRLKDWLNVETFNLEFEFNFQRLLSDFQRVLRLGFIDLPKKFLKEINSIKIGEGSFKAKCGYEKARSLFSYHILGSKITFESYSFSNFQLTGAKKGSLWTIDQLLLDDFSMAFDLLKENEIWKVNFLGLRFGSSVLAGIEGKYFVEEQRLEAAVNLLEVQLEYLKNWPVFNRICADLNLSGQLRASGHIEYAFDHTKPNGNFVSINMNSSLTKGKIKGLFLEDIENMSLNYASDKGFILSNIHTALKSGKEQSFQADLMMDKIGCDFINRELILEGLHFHIPSENLPWLGENLQQSFPGAINQDLADVICLAKNTGDLSGALSFAISEPHFALKLSLEDGIYHYMGQFHNISRFTLDYDPFSLRVNCEYNYNKRRFALEARSPSESLQAGEIIVSDLFLSEQKDVRQAPLRIFWKKDHHYGFFIERIFGALCGIRCDLIRDQEASLESQRIFLVGKVEVDMQGASSLFKEEFLRIIGLWKIGSGYSLNGHLTINKIENKSLFENISFDGDLLGHNFEFLGCRFYTLSARTTCFANTLKMAEISIADSCGSLHIDELYCYCQNNQWHIEIPSFVVSEFRPSLMQLVEPTSLHFGKALVINRIGIKNIKGILGEKKSFVGVGQFNFANPPKNNLEHTIFAIPAEILARIGLDLAVLNPVKGSVDFQISEGKVLLRRFKDVYSKGRLSKFYLHGHNQSYFDFDGNLNVHIRMKQYNLLFKLAELFTFTIQGSIAKPSYMLQKQIKDEN